MNAVFRVDYSLHIGLGHLMRCLTLANALKLQDVSSYFICRQLPGRHQNLVLEDGHELIYLATPSGSLSVENSADSYENWLGVPWQQDADETLAVIHKRQLKPAWLIIDHYGIDYKWQNRLRSTKARILVIDDLANRKHSCDILLDSNYLRSETDYSNLVSESTRLYTGPDYVLLRPEFSQIRETVDLAGWRKKVIGGIKNILVFMGGADESNSTQEVLAGIARVDWNEKPAVDVVVGPLFECLDELKSFISRLDVEVTMHVSTRKMADLMLKADLAVGAAGSATWERCCLGLPTISLELADNQHFANSRLAGNGLVKCLDKNVPVSNGIKKAISELLLDKSSLVEISMKSLKLVDGKGAQRIARMVMELSLDTANPQGEIFC